MLLPLLRPDADLDWASYEGPDSLRPGPRGLAEPSEPPRGMDAVTRADLVLVPALAVLAVLAILAVVGFAVAQPAVGDNAVALLRDGFAFVSTLHVGGGFSPAVASAIAVVLFLAGVVSGLSGFAFSAVAACVLWLLPPLQAVPMAWPTTKSGFHRRR